MCITFENFLVKIFINHYLQKMFKIFINKKPNFNGKKHE
jgi:hypothetical protein